MKIWQLVMKSSSGGSQGEIEFWQLVMKSSSA
jgi:hypothetical protein